MEFSLWPLHCSVWEQDVQVGSSPKFAYVTREGDHWSVEDTRSNFTTCSIFDLINAKNALKWNTSTSSKVNLFLARYFPVRSEERDPEFILDD